MDCIRTATLSAKFNEATETAYGEAYVTAAATPADTEDKIIVMITIASSFEWKTHSRYRASGASAPNVSVDISWATNAGTNELCNFDAQVGTVSLVVNMEELPAPVFDPA